MSNTCILPILLKSQWNFKKSFIKLRIKVNSVNFFNILTRLYISSNQGYHNMTASPLRSASPPAPNLPLSERFPLSSPPVDVCAWYLYFLYVVLCLFPPNPDPLKHGPRNTEITQTIIGRQTLPKIIAMICPVGIMYSRCMMHLKSLKNTLLQGEKQNIDITLNYCKG